MTTTNDPRFALWAKTARNSAEPDRYHPLICHLIDVAMVTHTMWHKVLTPALRTRLANSLGIDDEDAAGTWIAFLAGVHDLGKASPVFQQKAPACQERLRAAGLTWRKNPDDPGHGTISALALRTILQKDFHVPAVVALTIASAIGGHHGVIPTHDKVNQCSGELKAGTGNWADARRNLAETLATVLTLPRNTWPSRIDPAAAMVLAGLVSVADWIGSDERYFSYGSDQLTDGVLDLGDYRNQAAHAAQRALSELHWLGWEPASDTRTFQQLFPALPTPPRPVQQEVGRLPGIPEKPGLVIVELPMGEGKTEAAFFLADRWGTALGQRGVYVAMPTMATSNQMFGRLREVLAQRYPGSTINLQLLHSHAAIAPELEALSTDDAPLITPEQVYGDVDALIPAHILAAEWFTRRKRGLLAPFGVGTVDQSLLAALQSRHVFVRLFGLAGKTIIFDEVHAYDTYMTTLFARLLEWLGAIGSSVIILSATLPVERRDALVRAYAQGAQIPLPEGVPAARYPRITWLTADGAGARHVATSAQARRTVHLQWVTADQAALAERIKGAMQSGGCVAVICNTVKRAQDMYCALRDLLPDDDVSLLHSRYPFKERNRREKAALIRFGKPGGTVVVEGDTPEEVTRPQRAVLVATQIIEQSLDLDFDLMVTDLAPVDLILQRSGRLWRHERMRPDGFTQPNLWIVEPERIEGDVPTFDGGSEYIYEPHILLRSWLALRNRATIAIPDDVEELIEEVYDARPCPADASPALRARWEDSTKALATNVEREQIEAKQRYLKPPSPDLELADISAAPREEDAPDLHAAHQALTRLIPPTAPVICLWKTEHGFALDQAGQHPVQLSARPNVAEARQLLAYSVSIANRNVVFTLLKQEPPKGWQRSPLLQHSHALFFSTEGVAEVNEKYQIRLDPELGILVEPKREEVLQ